ncbi:MAG: DUF1127 domain-containing protein [Alphaproteobacteria bacterium]
MPFDNPQMVVLGAAVTLGAERPHPAGPLAGLGRAIATWRRRARGRRQLEMLDDRMLHDIGLSRVDVWREARKPFWRA